MDLTVNFAARTVDNYVTPVNNIYILIYILLIQYMVRLTRIIVLNNILHCYWL